LNEIASFKHLDRFRYIVMFGIQIFDVRPQQNTRSQLLGVHRPIRSTTDRANENQSREHPSASNVIEEIVAIHS
jgi:hypothetical protein